MMKFSMVLFLLFAAPTILDSAAKAATPTNSAEARLLQQQNAALSAKLRVVVDEFKDKADRSELGELARSVRECLTRCQTGKQVRNRRSSSRRTIRRWGIARKDIALILAKFDQLWDRILERFEKVDKAHQKLLKGQTQIKREVERNRRLIIRAIEDAGGECTAGIKALQRLDGDVQKMVAVAVKRAYPKCIGASVMAKTPVAKLCIKQGGELFVTNGTFICERQTRFKKNLAAVEGVKPVKTGNGALAALKIAGLGLGLGLAGGAAGWGIAAASSPSGERPDGSQHANAGVKGGAIGLGVGLAVGLASGLAWASADGDI